ncbi:hypothetical protein V8E55_004069 [Tylopilus felleus]
MVMHAVLLSKGYCHVNVPHDKMNLSRVITEFSFGSYFLDIVQSLDSSFELAHELPTTYIAPRSAPLHTNRYSVTHYTRKLSNHEDDHYSSAVH